MIIRNALVILIAAVALNKGDSQNLSLNCARDGHCVFKLSLPQRDVVKQNFTGLSQQIQQLGSQEQALLRNISGTKYSIQYNESYVNQDVYSLQVESNIVNGKFNLLDNELDTAENFMQNLLGTVYVLQNAVLCLSDPTKCPIPETSRVDCHSDPNPNEASCASRGCIWDGAVLFNNPNADPPRCYFPRNTGYKSVSSDNTNLLVLNKMPGNTPSPFDKDIPSVDFISENVGRMLHLKFTDSVKSRYEPPVPLNLAPVVGSDEFYVNTTKIQGSDTFAFQVIRNSTGTVIWDTSLGGFIFSNQFIQLATYLPSVNVYGFGENVHQSLRHDLSKFKTWSMFSRDEAPWSGNEDVKNLYGVHPFYICVEDDGNTHGILLMNSNAMEYTLGPGPSLIYRSIGGIFDFYFFPGPKPEDVIQQYLGVIGKPVMPAYWALGFQLCRWGYTNLDQVKAAVDRLANYSIPHDVQVFDIDYMHRKLDFTYDNVNYAGMPDYMRQLQSGGMHIITILDPAIDMGAVNYSTSVTGVNSQVYIQWPTNSTDGISPLNQWNGTVNQSYINQWNALYPLTNNTSILLGVVWPDHHVAFPDWFASGTYNWWTQSIRQFHNTVPYDGIWIDMNEPANFGTNEAKPWYFGDGDTDHPDIKPLFCPNDSNPYDFPPYKTLAVWHFSEEQNTAPQLYTKTLCMQAMQGNGVYRHYDVHSLYGWSESKPTMDGMRSALNKRGIVLSRSNFVSGGQYAGHWLGDNFATWDDLRTSIIGIIEFNWFGYAYIGADICGFNDETYEELCLRWQQLGSFYPFSRNHNGRGHSDQDPGMWASVGAATRKALNVRYHYLPYLYTLFYYANTYGHTVVLPLFFEFTSDKVTLTVDKQFLWGPAFMVCPVYQPGVVAVRVYFPSDIWYSIYDHNYGMRVQTTGWTTLPAPLTSNIPLHVRGGSILPRQAPANNTVHARKNPLELLIAVGNLQSGPNQAIGHLFWDDGEVINWNSTAGYSNYYLFGFHYWQNATTATLKISMQVNANGNVSIPSLDIIEIMGYSYLADVSTLNYNGINIGSTPNINHTFSADKQWLYLQSAGLINFTTIWNASVLTWQHSPLPSNYVAKVNRVDCHPDPFQKYSHYGQVCRSAGCIWETIDTNDGNAMNRPFCFMPPTSGYSLKSTINNTLHLTRNNNTLSLPYGTSLAKLQITAAQSSGYTRVSITDPNNIRYTVPVSLLPGVSATSDAIEFQPIQMAQGNGFAFQMIRQSNQRVLWDTSIGGLYYADQYLQISTYLPSANIFGFGENVHQTLMHDLSKYKLWPMFSRDEPPDAEKENVKNLYGVHVFYLCMEPDGKAHGVFLLNSNAQEVGLGPAPSLTYRTIGGVLDFIFFPGPSPSQVIQQYLGVIGNPVMPAYWSLGFQICRYGYHNLSEVRDVIARTAKYDIPQDVQYIDIEYMDRYKDFTYANDTDKFYGLPDFVRNELHGKGMKFIPIIDPAIDIYSFAYTPAAQGLSQNAFITWPVGSNNQSYVTRLNSLYNTTKGTNVMLGVVWPDHHVGFPDWLNTAGNTSQYWTDQFVMFHSQVPYDGIWIDMNEPANFGTNEDHPWYYNYEDHPNILPLLCPSNNSLEKPPYETQAVHHFACDGCKPQLSTKTLCMTGKQGPNGMFNHYDVHSLYGWSEAQPTMQAMRRATGKRGIVISRSTYASSGRYTGHWLGDNHANTDHMRTSIIGIMEFNMFGIPYIGADICGYGGESGIELCLRWQQLGAFYTFSRNHNEINQAAQDPGVHPEVGLATAKAMKFRYHYLPYLYTLFYHAHFNGQTVIRPLFFEYPTDAKSYQVSKQFLWGPAFHVIPVVDLGVNNVTAYFPNDTWYSIYDFNYGQQLAMPGNVTLLAPTTSMVPVYVRGGYIIPRQASAKTTLYARRNAIELLIVPGQSKMGANQAMGDLFWDDGESININGTNPKHSSYFYFHFHFFQVNTTSELRMKMFNNGSSAGVNITTLDIIEIFGYQNTPDWTTFTFDGVALTVNQTMSSYNATTNILYIKTNNFIDLAHSVSSGRSHSTLTWSNV